MSTTQIATSITDNMMIAQFPSALTRSLALCWQAMQPTFMWGSPGTAKSDVHRQTAKRLGLNLLDVRLPLLDPVDLRGLPYVKKDKTYWAVPTFLPDAQRDGDKGVLFLDEFNAAPGMVQAACYQLVLDRRLGEYVLPEGWVIAAAGNFDSDGAVTTRMSTANKSRFAHMAMKVSFDDWRTWALQNDIHPAVIGFLSFRSPLLHQFDKKAMSFPCPRTWHFASNMAKGAPSRDIQVALFAGVLGDGAAVEFAAYLDLYEKLPPIDAIMMHPDTVAVPKDPTVLYAVASALAMKMDAKNIRQICRYLSRIDPEYSVLTMHSATAKTPSLTSTEEFIQFAVEHQSMMN